MKFHSTEIPGVMVIEPDILKDDRGFFFEFYHQKKYAEAGLNISFVQDNQSHSSKDSLRGLHLQKKNPQGKLVRVLAGEIFDVAVDVRVGSPTFKKWVGVTLSDKNYRGIYVPPGFLHGFLTLSATADVEYKCTDFYDGKDESGAIWNDPDLGVKWPTKTPVLSAKDQRLPRLNQLLNELSSYPAYHV